MEIGEGAEGGYRVKVRTDVHELLQLPPVAEGLSMFVAASF